jgi:hypothetical protein
MGGKTVSTVVLFAGSLLVNQSINHQTNQRNEQTNETNKQTNKTIHFRLFSKKTPNRSIYMRHRQPNAKQVPTHQPKKRAKLEQGEKKTYKKKVYARKHV